MQTATKTTRATRMSSLANGDGEMPSSAVQSVTIPAPRFDQVRFTIKGTAPLVICRFSVKAREAISVALAQGSTTRSKRKRVAVTEQDSFDAARYHSREGWEGFHASAIRNGMVSACRLVGFKMTLAKLSVFVEPDGWDNDEPQIPLIRIYGKSVPQTDAVRNANTGQFSVSTRAAYHDWTAKVAIRWDADQFTLQDVANLLARVGMQVGIGCGRPDSKDSAGMGWGLFSVVESE
jgi:hypothetical protein